MGSPDWSKIPFEKMPEWKREEVLARSKQTVEQIETINPLKCQVCGKVCKSKLGLNAHSKSHNK